MKVDGREEKGGREKPRERICIFPVLVLIYRIFCHKALLRNRNPRMAVLSREAGTQGELQAVWEPAMSAAGGPHAMWDQ